MKMYSRILQGILLGILAFSSVPAKANPTVVYAGNEPCFVVRTPGNCSSLETRKNICQERLIEILAKKDFTFLVKLDVTFASGKQFCHSGAIYVGGKLLVTILPADAQANNTTIEGLSALWLSQTINSLLVASGFQQ